MGEAISTVSENQEVLHTGTLVMATITDNKGNIHKVALIAGPDLEGLTATQCLTCITGKLNENRSVHSLLIISKPEILEYEGCEFEGIKITGIYPVRETERHPDLYDNGLLVLQITTESPKKQARRSPASTSRESRKLISQMRFPV